MVPRTRLKLLYVVLFEVWAVVIWRAQEVENRRLLVPKLVHLVEHR